MLQLGLKLFASNTHLVEEARQLLDEGVFSYIELYIPPGTYASSIDTWRHCGADFVIHAPHWGHGVNLSDSSLRTMNAQIIKESQLFADALHADCIIVHGGNNGTVCETGRQLRGLADSRMMLENVPVQGTKGEKGVIYSPEHMRDFLASGIISSFILDIGHAIYAANDLGVDFASYLNEFIALTPKGFHLADGDSAGVVDIHLKIGNGSFDFDSILSHIADASRVTLETPRQQKNMLAEARKDAAKIIDLYKKQPRGDIL